jgi:cyclic pyranopterin phosphate synthase
MSDPPGLVDSYGRRVRSLRVSLTDQCNFRCVYCTPPDGYTVTPKSDQLTVDEVVRVVSLASRHGVDRVRLTGGEPLLRRDIVDVVGALRGVETLDEISITTNASRLAPLAEPLESAGLDRVNVSLDSLDPARFGQVARARQYDSVRDGIEAALRVGFPLKVNVVVMRGMDDDEIARFVDMAIDNAIEVRFLEFMPLCGDGWQAAQVYPIAEVRDVVRARFEGLGLVEQPRGDRTAQTFALGGTGARVGFIGSLTEPFCASCSRIRVSADGKIRPCLFSDYEVELKAVLRGGATDEELLDTLREAVFNKPAGNEFVDAPFSLDSDRKRKTAANPLIRTVGG